MRNRRYCIILAILVLLIITGCEEQGNVPTASSEYHLMAPTSPPASRENALGAVAAPLVVVADPSMEVGWVLFNVSANGILHINIHVDKEIPGGNESPNVYLTIGSFPVDQLRHVLGELKLNHKGVGNFHGTFDVSSLITNSILAKVVICGTTRTDPSEVVVPLKHQEIILSD